MVFGGIGHNKKVGSNSVTRRKGLSMRYNNKNMKQSQNPRRSSRKSGPMPLNKRIMEVLRRNRKEPVRLKDLAVFAKVQPRERKEFDQLIAQYKAKGKKLILNLLKDKYNIEEKDFESAELEIVPAGNARDLGLDRSLILAYGQDDRSCAFASFKAMLEVENVNKTTCCICVDKEEIGSVGATGMASHVFENAVAEIIAKLLPYSDLTLRRCLANSNMLSSDVNAAFDPMNPGLYDKDNASFLGGGIVFNKYTGSRGKSGASDANPEFIAKLRKINDDANVSYQMAELGKVDQGGGGTIAYLAAKYGMNVIDAGVAVLSMHAPWEIVSKEDMYQAYSCYKAFLQAN